MPAPPLDRLLAAGVLCRARQTELTAHLDSLNPPKIAREIAELQTRMLIVAKDEIEQLCLASIPTLLPDVGKGMPIKARSVCLGQFRHHDSAALRRTR